MITVTNQWFSSCRVIDLEGTPADVKMLMHFWCEGNVIVLSRDFQEKWAKVRIEVPCK